MLKSLLNIFLFSCTISLVLAKHVSKTSATVLDGFPDDLNIEPFTRVDKKLYHFGQSRVSWYKAHLICRSIGGYLASFDNQHELTVLSEYLKSTFPTDRWWWIAGSDVHNEGEYYWYNTGELMTYSDWSTGQPDNAGGNENCVFLWLKSLKYQMNDWICANAAYYICEADQPKTAVVTIF